MEIQGYPNYLIYEDGRVFSKIRRRFLKGSFKNDGYIHITFPNDKKIRVHRLVAQHYIPNPHNYPLIDHIDRNRVNNDISNLRWVNNSMNQQNTNISKNNKSGHKNINKNTNGYGWRYQKEVNGKRVARSFKSKIDALCYKYIILLKIKCSLIL